MPIDYAEAHRQRAGNAKGGVDPEGAKKTMEQSSTAGAGLGSLANRVRKRPPMPMLTDFGGDEKAHAEALRKWRAIGEESPAQTAQKKVLSQ